MEFVLVQHDPKSSTPRGPHLFGWMPLWFQSQAASVEGGPCLRFFVAKKYIHCHTPFRVGVPLRPRLRWPRKWNMATSTYLRNRGGILCVCATTVATMDWAKIRKDERKQNQTTQKKQQQNGKAKSLKRTNQESWSRSSHFLRWCELI